MVKSFFHFGRFIDNLATIVWDPLADISRNPGTKPSALMIRQSEKYTVKVDIFGHIWGVGGRVRRCFCSRIFYFPGAWQLRYSQLRGTQFRIRHRYRNIDRFSYCIFDFHNTYLLRPCHKADRDNKLGPKTMLQKKCFEIYCEKIGIFDLRKLLKVKIMKYESRISISRIKVVFMRKLLTTLVWEIIICIVFIWLETWLIYLRKHCSLKMVTISIINKMLKK